MQPPTIPITIRKSLVGQIGIWGVGIATVAVLLAAALSLQAANPTFSNLLGAGAFIAILATLIQSYVYGLSRAIITAKELDVVNYATILSQTTGTLEWNQVQDVELRMSSLGSIFGYGTLIVHAANDQRDLTFTWTPRPQHWHDYMMQLAEAAVIPVHDE